VENLLCESAWTAEAYGGDAVTSISLAQLSVGRFIAGLGASDPQVIEGWDGMPYGKPVI